MGKERHTAEESELRYLPVSGADLRASKTEDGKMVVEGYAIVYNQETVLYDDGEEMDVETILPGAATRALESEDQRYLAHHDRSQPLARKSIGTLAATEGEKGVFIHAELVDNQRGRDTFEDIRTGLIDGQSFAFFVAKGGESWEIKDVEGKRVYKRSISEFDSVPEFSAVTFPAYPQATLQARSLELALRNRPKPEASGEENTAVLEVMRDSRENLAQIIDGGIYGR